MISIPCTITDVFERKFNKHSGGVGPAAVFSSASAGWYIQINETFSIYVGAERPDFNQNDSVILQIRKPE